MKPLPCTLFAALLLIPLMTAFAAGAEADDGRTWTMAEAIEYALSNNPDIAVLRADINIAQESQDEVYGNYLPQVNLEGGYQYIDNVPSAEISIQLPEDLPIDLDIPPKKLEMGSHDNYKADLSLNQLMFSSGRVYYGHRALGHQVRAKRHELEAIEIMVAQNTAEAYLGILISHEVYEAQLAALESAGAHLQHVTNRYNAGASSRFDLLRAQVEVSNLEAEVQKAFERTELAKTGLRRAMGLAEQTDINIQGRLETDVEELDVSQAIENALLNRPEFSALAAGERAFLDAAKSRRAEMLPSMVFTSSVGYQKPYFFDLEGDFNWTIGVGIRLPVFDGLKAYHGMGQNRARAESMRLTRTRLRADVATQVEAAALSWREATVLVDKADENVKRAEDMVQIAENSYKAGAITSLEVIDAQLALTSARVLHLKALYDYRIAQVNLAAATGDIEEIWRLAR